MGKTVNGTSGIFTWDDNKTPNVLTDGTNDYLYGPGGLPVEQIGAGGPSWFVHDGLGSTIGLLNAVGAVTGRYDYTPYGVATFTGTTSTPLQFTGQYTDTESHLLYLRARYYDPATALFLTVDPLVDRTGTPYAYAGDNPLVAIDPTGLGFWDIVTDVGEAVVIGAVDIGEEFLTDGAATPFLAEEDSAIAAGFSALRGLIGGYAKAEVLGNTINDLGCDSGGSAAAAGGVCTLRDDDGNVQYVGRTNNFGKRQSAQDPPDQPAERQPRKVPGSSLQVHWRARMTRRGAKQKYVEGDWVAVPLVGGGYALGVIARTTKKSQSTLFGYFFGPKRETLPSLSDAEGLRREDALWTSVFGDVGLYDGSWVVLGRLADWDRDAWRMPAFVHRDSLVGLFSLVEYPGDDPGERPSRRRITEEEARGLPESGSAGSGFVEQRLTKLLS
ncbi:RHS repeat-associated core domain-containing protein [Amycolatopsis tolypomycina]|uniref:RHS repeat-associated core domain-containing protein n=2 Tax=Amycolatopsis TaxID=1813 RepID=A0A1H4PFK2_9PSEU|nr:RHS repeat-associated core domain-containing protein [Amycolatopsis tolypomycina]SEC06121.1 RHS repeat-associated core domain-containing protein [Amycolatopsis tolypomycina]